MCLLCLIFACQSVPPRPAVHERPPRGKHSGRSVADSACGTFDEAPTISDVSVSCDGTKVVYSVKATHSAVDGWIYEVESGGSNPWSENLPLEADSFSMCNDFGSLAAILQTGVAREDAEEGVSTPFTCVDFDAGALTFAALVFDMGGAPADCVVWGHDPASLVAGSLAGAAPPAFDVAACRTIGE